MAQSSREAHGREFEFDVCKLKLGSGGSGTVFLAQNRYTRELVAVKRLFAKPAAGGGGHNSHRQALHAYPHHTPATRRMSTSTDAMMAIQSLEGDSDDDDDDDDDNDNGSGDGGSNAASPVKNVEYQSSCSSVTGNGSTQSEYDDNNYNYHDAMSQEHEHYCVEIEKGENEESGAKSFQVLGEARSHTARPPCESTILQYLGPHNHIVKFLGSYTSSSRTTFFAMELMDSDLGRELRAANTAFMREDVVCQLLHGIVSAIAHLHKRGIAHRDIKPSNILLRRMNAAKKVISTVGQCASTSYGREFNNSIDSSNGDQQLQNGFSYEETRERKKEVMEENEVVEEVKATLGDFSVAHFVHESSTIRSGRGTLYYKSPEQLLDRAENYFACDMWSLGCTLFELSTGSVAFCGSTELQVLHQIYAKLGTDFKCYPNRVSEATLFDSLSSPSAVFLDFLKGLLSLDPQKRLTAHEALEHPFFDPVRRKYGPNSDNMEVTFPLRPRYQRPEDASQFVFRPVAVTPMKRSNMRLRGNSAGVKSAMNGSDASLSGSVQRCSMWSSSFSVSRSPRSISTCMKSYPGGLGSCTAARRLSISSCTPRMGGMNTHKKDENGKTVGQSVSPAALSFSPATSLKCCGCSHIAMTCGTSSGGTATIANHNSGVATAATTTTTAAAAAVSILPQTAVSHGRMPRWTPASFSNVTFGNARTNFLFERSVLGDERGTFVGVAGGGCPSGARLPFDDDSHSHSCHYDTDSPPVSKMLFESPHQTLINHLNDSSDNAEKSLIVVDEP